jgi:hypothetical protein
LRLEKKRFEFYDPKSFISNWQQFLEDDQEASQFPLKEASIDFPPTYVLLVIGYLTLPAYVSDILGVKIRSIMIS